jgi:hypothetical protein
MCILYLFLCVLEYYLSYGRGLIGPYDNIRIIFHCLNVFFKWGTNRTPGHVMNNTK